MTAESQYFKSARQASAEGLRPGGHEWWDRIRELNREANA